MSNKKFISIEEFFNQTLPNLQNNPDGDKTVIFIGAGLSTNYGCASWDVLARNVIEKCHNNGMDYITSQDLLKKEGNYKTLLTIGKSFFKNIINQIYS